MCRRKRRRRPRPEAPAPGLRAARCGRLDQTGNTVTDEEGAPLEVEFLIDASVFEKVLAAIQCQHLKLIGVDAWIEQVDPVDAVAAERLRLRRGHVCAEPSSRLTSTACQIFGSRRRPDTPGTYNAFRHQDPVVDALLSTLPSVRAARNSSPSPAPSDRVVRAGTTGSRTGTGPTHNVAHWDLFGWTENKPDYAFPPETTWWFDRDKATAIEHGGVRNLMGAYVLRCGLLFIPTIVGIMAISFLVVQFAGRPDRAHHRPDPGAPMSPPPAASAGGERLPGRIRSRRRRRRDQFEVSRGARARSPEFIRSLEVQFGFDKPADRALRPDAVELHPLRFRRELFPRHQRHRPDPREDAGLDLARALDDPPLLRDLDPARHRQGGARRLALRRLDLGVDHHRLRHPRLPLRHPADHPLCRRRASSNWFPLRGLWSDQYAGTPFWQWITNPRALADYFWHLVLPLMAMALGGLRDHDASRPRTRSSTRSASST